MSVEAVLLGTAQDAGLPQPGCDCTRCLAARVDSQLMRLPVSLGIVDHEEERYWIIDASPALPVQLNYLRDLYSKYVLSGILLTHAHIGHYTGLIHFGKESWNLRQLPIYISESMHHFLKGNQPWRNLLENNFSAIIFNNNEESRLSDALTFRPVQVPHRAEFSDTHAFVLSTEERKLFYCPDVDNWVDFPILEVCNQVDIALLDGTFYSKAEIPGRDFKDIPHPLATDTLMRTTGAKAEVYLIHLNHSNPLNDDRKLQQSFGAQGIRISRQWDRYQLTG